MKFGPHPAGQSEGTILAHSIRLGARRLRKGRILSAADSAALVREGITEVIVARSDPSDVGEDEAAARLAAALAPDPAALGLSVQAPFTGRVNLHAEQAGILRVDAEAVRRFNGVDEAVTLATLPDHARVAPRDMIATVKILPFAVAEIILDQAVLAFGPGAVLRVHGLSRAGADIIATRIPGMKESLIEKGFESVRTRLSALGMKVQSQIVSNHEAGAVAAALSACTAPITLILGASATQDRADVGPAAVIAAGGSLERFGMPVDPGNLLFLGDLHGRPVIGLPGCVRSPALNGADWVLERIACGLPLNSEDIAGMGVGGLLKEIPSRPQPRAGAVSAARRPRIAALLLAAGAARRMGGRDKLLEKVDGEVLIRRMAGICQEAGLSRVIAVIPAEAPERRAALGEMGLDLEINPAPEEGMASSIRVGMASVGEEIDAVLLVLADMPELSAEHLRRLVAAFDPDEGREICRAVTGSGQPGHPVLFGRRFFETLRGLEGDRGARDVLAGAADYLVDVPTPGEAAAVDLDTPEAWSAWRAGRASADAG